MRITPLLVALTLVALSGCSEEATPPIEPTSSVGGNVTAQPVSNTTVNETLPAPVNTPPVVSIVADVLNGTAPLLVNFTVETSDAEGDNVTWSLSVNGTQIAIGTTVPATVAHTFEAGNWTVVASATDGNSTTEETLDLSVSPGGPELRVLEFSGTVLMPDPTSYTHTNCLQGLATQPDGAPGSTWFDLPAETWGGTYSIDAEGIEVRFSNSETADVPEAGTAGTVPADVDIVEACGMTAVNTEFTITILY